MTQLVSVCLSVPTSGVPPCSGYAPRGQGRPEEQQGLTLTANGGKEQQEMDDILEDGDSSVFIKVRKALMHYLAGQIQML